MLFVTWREEALQPMLFPEVHTGVEGYRLFSLVNSQKHFRKEEGGHRYYTDDHSLAADRKLDPDRER